MNLARFASLATIALALSACQQQKTAEDASATGAPSEATAGPEAKPGIAVTDGVLVLPAVRGRPGAAYFAVANRGPAPTSIAAISIDGADKAEMHETKGGSMSPLGAVEIKPGESLRFERGGKHVMVFDIAESVKAGGTAEMTLVFADGDKVSAPLRVEAAGGASGASMSGMDGMGHGEHD